MELGSSLLPREEIPQFLGGSRFVSPLNTHKHLFGSLLPRNGAAQTLPSSPVPFAMSLSCCRLQKTFAEGPKHLALQQAGSGSSVILTPFPSSVTASSLSACDEMEHVQPLQPDVGPPSFVRRKKRKQRIRITCGDSCLHVKQGPEPSVDAPATGSLLGPWELELSALQRPSLRD